MANATFKTFDDLMRAALAIWPDAILQEDADGEILVMTNYRHYGKNGQVRIHTKQD